jgi:light-regulated signal transduction histidine kinase (bacteriophytochrome)
MQGIIDDLLAFSQVGRLEVSRERVDCHQVLTTVLAGLAPRIDETGAEVSVGELPVIEAEPTQLNQVFQNLLSNALKFVRPGAHPHVTITAERTGAFWQFNVTDDGIGIDPAHRERIFGMFKRLHSREDYPGSGIGLALAKKIIERHGGSIGVAEGPRGGSRFWFTLKAREEVEE